MKEAARIVPAAVPSVLAHDPELGAFAMEYLEPATNPVWKVQLLQGRVDPATAGAVGRVLVAIHAGTAASPTLARRFANESVFRSIRLEPYFEATAKVQPDLRGALDDLVADTLASKLALVHGDVSPKNILIGPEDRCFSTPNVPAMASPPSTWPSVSITCSSSAWPCRLIRAPCSTASGACRRLTSPASAGSLPKISSGAPPVSCRPLLLARVDGKSPVEYITAQEQKAVVRRAAKPMIARPPHRLSDVAAAWAEDLRR